MVRRLFIDLETTGNGTDDGHDIIEVCARYYENEKMKSEFNAHYSGSPTTVYQAGINFDKAAKYKAEGYENSDAGFAAFDT